MSHSSLAILVHSRYRDVDVECTPYCWHAVHISLHRHCMLYTHSTYRHSFTHWIVFILVFACITKIIGCELHLFHFLSFFISHVFYLSLILVEWKVCKIFYISDIESPMNFIHTQKMVPKILWNLTKVHHLILSICKRRTKTDKQRLYFQRFPW